MFLRPIKRPAADSRSADSINNDYQLGARDQQAKPNHSYDVALDQLRQKGPHKPHYIREREQKGASKASS